MPQEIITLSDLTKFREDLTNEITELFKISQSHSRKWLKFIESEKC